MRVSNGASRSAEFSTRSGLSVEKRRRPRGRTTLPTERRKRNLRTLDRPPPGAHATGLAGAFPKPFQGVVDVLMATTTPKQRLLNHLFTALKKSCEVAEAEPRPVLEQL